jgi:hypothetical protein
MAVSGPHGSTSGGGPPALRPRARASPPSCAAQLRDQVLRLRLPCTSPVLCCSQAASCSPHQAWRRR